MNVYMDTNGCFYKDESPHSPNDCLLPHPRDSLVSFLTNTPVSGPDILTALGRGLSTVEEMWELDSLDEKIEESKSEEPEVVEEKVVTRKFTLTPIAPVVPSEAPEVFE